MAWSKNSGKLYDIGTTSTLNCALAYGVQSGQVYYQVTFKKCSLTFKVVSKTKSMESKAYVKSTLKEVNFSRTFDLVIRHEQLLTLLSFFSPASPARCAPVPRFKTPSPASHRPPPVAGKRYDMMLMNDDT